MLLRVRSIAAVAVGCLQAQQCHTDHCPTGVATQDPTRQRGIDVPTKAVRVAQFHAETVRALAELIAAAGLEHPRELSAHHLMQRAAPDRVVTFAELYRPLKHGELLAGTDDVRFRDAWAQARSDSFAPAVPEPPNSPALAAE